MVNHILRSRRGTAAAEFALVAPVFFMVVFASMDLSWYMVHWHDVQRAAREGARVGSMVIEGENPTGAAIRAEAEAQALRTLEASGIDCAETTCNIDTVWLENDDGFRFLKVTVGVPFNSFVPGMGLTPEYTTASFHMMTQQQ